MTEIKNATVLLEHQPLVTGHWFKKPVSNIRHKVTSIKYPAKTYFSDFFNKTIGFIGKRDGFIDNGQLPNLSKD